MKLKTAHIYTCIYAEEKNAKYQGLPKSMQLSIYVIA